MKIQNIQKIKMGDWEKKKEKLKIFDFLYSSKIKKNKMFYNLFFKSKCHF